MGGYKEADVLRRLQCNSAIVAMVVLFGLPFCASAAGFIDTPDECYLVSKVDQKKRVVHLAPLGNCMGKPGRAFVALDGQVAIFRDGKEWNSQSVQPLSFPDVSKTLAEVEKIKKSLQIPKNKLEKEMQKEAAKTIAIYQSPEYQTKIAAETDRIKRELFHEQLKDLPVERGGLKEGEKLQQKEQSAVKLAEDERVYLFISSSMPLDTVRNYAFSVAHLSDPKKIVLVMRGFINGATKIGPTTSYIVDVLKVNPSCDLAREECSLLKANVLIDPLLFRRFNITQVPATVFAKGVRSEVQGQSEGETDVQIASFWTVYGDASLAYNLAKIRVASGSASLDGSIMVPQER